MATQDFIYEQRDTTLRSGALAEYTRQLREKTWPRLDTAGATVLCLLRAIEVAPQG